MNTDTESGKGHRDRRGTASALIVVLWVIVLLSLLIGSFVFDAHIEARITSYYRKRTKAEYLARSGIEIAEMLMTKSTEIKKTKSEEEKEEEEEEDRWYSDAKRLSEGDTTKTVENLGEGTVTVEIKPERARRNVNTLKKEKEWEGILEVGDIPEEMWPELIESFLDWTDGDDIPRVDGAETEDYYATLDTPYRAKNADLDAVGELLLIKGFNKTILEGGVLETGIEGEEAVHVSGIKDLLTIYGDTKVNINAASRRVLMTLPDSDGTIDLIAGAIIEEREGLLNENGEKENSFFADDSDMFSRVPELRNAPLKDYVTTASSTYYRITSIGEVQGVKRGIWCIVEYSGGKMTILRWREEGLKVKE